MPVVNASIAAIFERIADLLDIQGANPFRIRAYRNAARTLGGLPPAAALTLVSDVATRSPAALLGAAEEILARRGDPGIPGPPPMPAMVVLGARDAVVPVSGVQFTPSRLPSTRPQS